MNGPGITRTLVRRTCSSRSWRSCLWYTGKGFELFTKRELQIAESMFVMLLEARQGLYLNEPLTRLHM